MTGPNVPTRSPLRALLLILVIAVLAILVLVLAFRAGHRAHVEDQIRSGTGMGIGDSGLGVRDS